MLTDRKFLCLYTLDNTGAPPAFALIHLTSSKAEHDAEKGILDNEVRDINAARKQAEQGGLLTVHGVEQTLAQIVERMTADRLGALATVLKRMEKLLEPKA